MSLYRALRGVCIGPGQHITPADDPVSLDKATAQFLLSIKAVEEVPAVAAPVAPPTAEPVAPAASPAPAPAPSAPPPAAAPAATNQPKPAEPAKKEK